MRTAGASLPGSTPEMLTERDGHLGRLERRLAELSGHPRSRTDSRPVLTLTGPVGSGKTAVLQTFAQQVTEAGVGFLCASASRAERAVPFEVLRQLVRSAALTADARGQVNRMLDEGARAWLDGAGPDDAARITAAIGGAVLDVAAGSPLVIAVDDVHEADVPSLRCLDYVARLGSSLALLVVLTEAPRTRPWHPQVYAELLQPARVHRIRLPLLSADGTYALLAGQLGVPVARSISAECHRISGGSPLLVRALADDHLSDPGRQEDRPVVGESFREAVLSCLYRCEPVVLQVARGLAVSEEKIGASLLPRLADVDSESTLHAIDTHTSAGLIDGGRLRHRAVSQAVLHGMAAEERTRLHRTAADLLHRDGATGVAVARHLVNIGELDEPWMTRTLLEVGEQALWDGEVDAALRYLRRANRTCTGQGQQARVRSALVHAEWQLNPHAAVPHLDELSSAARSGHLRSRQAVEPVHYLLWHGLIDEAVELVRQLHGRIDGSDRQSAVDLSAAWGWMSLLYPGIVAHSPGPTLSQRDHVTLSQVRQRLRGVDMLADVLDRGDPGAVERAEQALLTTGLDDETDCWTVICALLAMIYADRLELADAWCLRLKQDRRTDGRPAKSALIGAIQAIVTMRRGDLHTAQRLLSTVLSQLSPQGWGVAIGLPLTARLHALTFLDELDAAAACLQTPVPPALFETPFGLHYLHARGLYALAAGSPDGALADFQLCGQLMAQWRLDLPALVPWRTGAAQALLRQGRREQAGRLVREELSRLRPAHVRRRGAALRVLAATDDPPARLRHLQTSVRLLEQSGDHLELVQSLADLGRVYHQLGEPRRARASIRAASELAQQCGLPPIRRGRPATRQPATGLLASPLSDREATVAALAAQGHTNREIAEKLFLTVSTIEQRLTRVYRKLEVHSRTELAAQPLLAQPDATPGWPS